MGGGVEPKDYALSCPLGRYPHVRLVPGVADVVPDRYVGIDVVVAWPVPGCPRLSARGERHQPSARGLLPLRPAGTSTNRPGSGVRGWGRPAGRSMVGAPFLRGAVDARGWLLMPVLAMPWAKCRWRTRKTSGRGDDGDRAGEQHPVVGPVGPTENRASATGSVYMSSVCATTSGHRKLFHEPRKVRMASVASAGPQSGRTMRVKMRLAGAVDAGGLESASGIPLMNWRMRNTPIGPARNGRISAG